MCVGCPCSVAVHMCRSEDSWYSPSTVAGFWGLDSFYQTSETNTITYYAVLPALFLCFINKIRGEAERIGH